MEMEICGRFLMVSGRDEAGGGGFDRGIFDVIFISLRNYIEKKKILPVYITNIDISHDYYKGPVKISLVYCVCACTLLH